MYQNIPYNNPYQMSTFVQTPQIQQPLPQMEVVRVNGKQGAEAFRMAPNSSALLLDERDAVIWFVRTDGAGYQTVVPYDFSPHQDEADVAQKNLNDRLDAFEERLKSIEEALK